MKNPKMLYTRITKEQHKTLKLLAILKRKKMYELVNEALQEFLDNHKIRGDYRYDDVR